MMRTVLKRGLGAAVLTGALALGVAGCGEGEDAPSESIGAVDQSAGDTDTAGDLGGDGWVRVTWSGETHEFDKSDQAVQMCNAGFDDGAMSFVTVQLPDGPEFHTTFTRGDSSYIARLDEESSQNNEVTYDDDSKVVSGSVTFDSGVVDFEMTC